MLILRGYHAIDCLVTCFNALVAEWKRDLILSEDAEEHSISLYRIRAAIAKLASKMKIWTAVKHLRLTMMT
jgi:hypothetical protein